MSSSESRTIRQIVNAAGVPLLAVAMLVSGGVATCLGARLLLGRLGPEAFPLVVSDYVWIVLWVLLAEAACVGIGVAAFCMVSRRLSRPLERLASAVDALERRPGREELDADTGIAELDSLAESFNRQQAVRMRQSDEIRNIARNVMHDLRAPVTNIYNEADRLSHSLVSGDEAAASVMAASRAILAMVDANAEISRNYGGVADSAAEVLDLSRIVRESAEMYSVVAEEKGLRLDISVPGGPVPFSGHDAKLRRLVANLLDNAFKFTESGKVELSAEARPDGDGTVALHIAVKDTGCGIPPERLAHLFDPREDDGAGRGCPGPGLGLSVVKRLLDSCGGAIDIDSAVGRGTGVYIRIGRLALADRPDEPAAKIAMPTVPDDFGVLVVDDVGVNLKVLALRVKKTGIKDVRTASSGEEALRLFAERRPHLVLTDLWMPGMDGVALAAAIRKEGGTMPIVAITADSDARTSFDMSEFDGIITKPVSHDKLRAVIARAAKSIRPQQSAGRAQTKAQP